MEHLEGLKLLGYNIKKYRLGHIVAKSPQGKVTVYNPSGELLANNISRMEYIDEYLQIKTDEHYQVFNLYTNKKIVEVCKDDEYRIRIANGLVLLTNGIDHRLYNRKGERIGTGIEPSRLLGNPCYNEQTDNVVYRYNEYVYVHNKQMAKATGLKSYSSHYFIVQKEKGVYRDALYTPLYELRSTIDGELISDLDFTSFNFLRDMAVVSDVDNTYYIAQGKELTKIDIGDTFILNVQIAHDNERDIHLIVDTEEYTYLYDINTQEVKAKYTNINRSIHNRLVKVKNEPFDMDISNLTENNSMLIDLDGRELLKENVYRITLSDYHIEIQRNRDSQVERISYDEIRNKKYL